MAWSSSWGKFLRWNRRVDTARMFKILIMYFQLLSTSVDIVYGYSVALNIFIFVDLPVETKAFFRSDVQDNYFLKLNSFLVEKDKNLKNMYFLPLP